jgi:uncharacterized sporulation protein YeaH/YhbH (DUF444 family)
MISSAYKLCVELVNKRFPPEQWNIYALHFSDGDNWGEDDNVCLKVLREKLLPMVNLFGYSQVTSPYGSGRFIDTLRRHGSADNLVATEVGNRDAIFDAIKAILGKGK